MYRTLLFKLPAHKLARLSLSINILTLLLICILLGIFIYEIKQRNLRDNAEETVQQWAVQLSTHYQDVDIAPLSQTSPVLKHQFEQTFPALLDNRQHHFIVARLQNDTATKPLPDAILNHAGIHADTLLNLPEWAYIYTHKQGSVQYYVGTQRYFAIYTTLPTLNWTIGLGCTLLFYFRNDATLYFKFIVINRFFLVLLSFLLHYYQRCYWFKKLNAALAKVHQINPSLKETKNIKNCIQLEANTDALLAQTQHTVQHLLKERNHLKAVLSAMKIRCFI